MSRARKRQVRAVIVLIGLLGTSLAAILATTAAATARQDEWQTLLGVQQITKDIALSRVAWAGGTFAVNLDGPVICESRNPIPKLLSDMTIQVWLLQASGTVLAQERKPTHTAVGNLGCRGNPVQFWFKENGADPIAVVIKIDSTMIVREINRVFRK